MTLIPADVAEVLRRQLEAAGADSEMIAELVPAGGGLSPYTAEDLVFAKVDHLLRKGIATASPEEREAVAEFLLLLEFRPTENPN